MVWGIVESYMHTAAYTEHTTSDDHYFRSKTTGFFCVVQYGTLPFGEREPPFNFDDQDFHLCSSDAITGNNFRDSALRPL